MLTDPFFAPRSTEQTESYAFMQSICELDSFCDVLPAGLCAFPDF